MSIIHLYALVYLVYLQINVFAFPVYKSIKYNKSMPRKKYCIVGIYAVVIEIHFWWSYVRIYTLPICHAFYCRNH